VSQQTLSIRGKRLHITTEDLLHLAKENNIKKGKHIIAQITTTVQNWKHYAKQAEVREDLAVIIEGNLNVG